MLKYGTVRIERCDFLHHQELDVAQRGFLHVHDVYLYALQQFTLTHGVEGFRYIGLNTTPGTFNAFRFPASFSASTHCAANIWNGIV